MSSKTYSLIHSFNVFVGHLQCAKSFYYFCTGGGVGRRDSIIFKKMVLVRHQWLMPVILATWEFEIGRIVVQGQHKQIVQETLPAPPTPISKISRAK
jgi:hypothetical protein